MVNLLLEHTTSHQCKDFPKEFPQALRDVFSGIDKVSRSMTEHLLKKATACSEECCASATAAIIAGVASRDSKNKELMDFLIQPGVLPKIPQAYVWNLGQSFHNAVSDTNIPLAKWILDQGLSVDSKVKYNKYTPLMLTAKS